MPQYTLNRDFVLRNTKGVITFTKGEPTNVPSYMVMDAVSIGAEAVGAETPSLVPVDLEQKVARKVLIARNRFSPPSPSSSRRTTPRTSPRWAPRALRR